MNRRIAAEDPRLNRGFTAIRLERCTSFAEVSDLREVLPASQRADQQRAARQPWKLDARLRRVVSVHGQLRRTVKEDVILRVPATVPRAAGEPACTGNHVSKNEMRSFG